MANKQYLIELAVKDDKLKSSLKKSLESPDIQKTLGILGENITEYLERDVGKAASILGKVDWASLLGEKDFERLQQIVAKTVSANKDMIKSFVKTGDTKGIQDTIRFVSDLGAALKEINPDVTVDGLARSMKSFMKVVEPLANTPDKIVSAFSGMADGVDKSIASVYNRAGKTIAKMQNDVLKPLKTQLDVAGESIIKYQIDDKELDEYIKKFTDTKSVAEELNKEIETSQAALRKLSNADTRDASTMLSLVKHEQKINALMSKLSTLQPKINGGNITKDIDVTIEQVVDKLEKSFNKVIEDKLSSIKVKIDVPTEEKLIADINAVIAKVNAKGTNSLKLVGAESAINEAQNKILANTQEWHNRMKEALKFDKKEDITLDLGVKLREIGSNVGDDLRRSIEEYFDNPANKVAVPVELVLTGENKAIIEGGGGNITINGGVGGGEITAESLAKALTTPIEIKAPEKQSENKPTGQFIYLDPEDNFSQNVLSVFDDLFKAIERGGDNAKKIGEFLSLKGLNLEELKKFKDTNPMKILNAYATFLENAKASTLDDVSENLAKGSTQNNATIAFRNLLRDSVFRFDLDNIAVSEDIKREQVSKLVKETYIPQSNIRDIIYKIQNTKSTDYKIPTVEELDKLMADLPKHWGTLGENFLPALDVLKQLRATISDPTNAQEIKRFQEAAEQFASEVNPFYTAMRQELSYYKIGVFNKNHNKHNKNPDRIYRGGAFSGSKIEGDLDNIDYFELYDDPSGHNSGGKRQDATDRMSRREQYQVRASARKASYRSKEPTKTNVLAEEVEVAKFEPKERPNEQLKEIEKSKTDAEKRAKATEDARKASAEEEKKAEELRIQELATDKKRRTALKRQRTKNENKLQGITDEAVVKEIKEKNAQLDQEITELDKKISENSVEPSKKPTVKQQLDVMPKAKDIQSMIDDVNAIDVKIDEANKQAEELDEWVNKNFKAEKKTDIGYTKSEKNNQSKNATQNSRLTTLNQVLNEQGKPTLSSLTNLTNKERDSVSKLLHDRQIYQLIGGEEGLGLPKNSLLEDIAKRKMQIYQEGLNQIDEFLLKHQGQTLRHIQDDSDWLDFTGLSRLNELKTKRDALEQKKKLNQGQLTDKDLKALSEVNAQLTKDENIRKMLAGTFSGSQEDEAAVKAQIDEFKTRMVKAGKSYVVDYIEMWSDKNLRALMQKDSVGARTTTDAKGDTILQEFYRRIVEGGVGKRDEAYQYLRTESAKYQKSIQQDEASVEKLMLVAWEQSEGTETKNQVAIDRVKEKYKEHVNQWLYTIQENMYNVLFGELDDKNSALLIKKNDELRGLVSSLASEYSRNFGESLLTEEQARILGANSPWYTEWSNRDVKPLASERDAKKTSLNQTMYEKAQLLRQRRFDLLNKISDGTTKGKDTASLEKALLEVEDELIKYSDQLPHLAREEFEADLLNAKKATEEEWKQFKENSTKRRNEFAKTKYTELKGRQTSLLSEIAQKTKAGESASEAQKQLEAVNKEIVQYEVHTARLKEIELGKFPNKSSVITIQTYNTEMEKLVRLQQKRALLEAQGQKSAVVTRDVEIAKQTRRLKNRVGAMVEADKRADAEYAPANQAAKFIESTDRVVYILDEQIKEAESNLRIRQRQLEQVMGEGYRNARAYDNRINALKSQDVAEYIRSGKYQADRDRGREQVNREFGAYLTEKLGEDVAKRIVYEFAQNEDRANIDEMLKGAGNTTRLVEDSFGFAYTKEYMKYTNSGSYNQLVSDKKAEREAQIDKEFAEDKAKLDTKIQEIWNKTQEDIAILKKADMANSQVLRDAVFTEAEKVGMGDSSEYRRAIVDQVKQDLIQQRIESGRQEQKFYNQEYYSKVRARRSELSIDMYKNINEQADRAVYDIVMSKIQELIGDNKDLMQGLEAKRAELMETHVGKLVDNYRDSLKFEETNMYKGQNIRELVIQELQNAVSYFEKTYIEKSGQLGVLKNERQRAKSFGELDYDETVNPEIAKVRATAEARLSAEKERQVELTERLTTLTERNADQKDVQAVAAELQTTEKEISRLQTLADGATEALSLRKEARDVAEAEKKFSLEKLRLWLIDDIESAKHDIDSDDFSKRTYAEKRLPFLEQKLLDVEKRISEAQPETSKPQTVLDMITHAIRDGLAGVTAGGNVDLDASLYNIATETTLQEILRLLGGNSAVEYANQLKAALEKDRPKYEKRSYEGRQSSESRSGGKNARRDASLDKLNDEGQRIYGELDAEAKLFTKSLKNSKNQYDKNFDFVKAINNQMGVLKGLEEQKKKGTLEYIREQTKLTALYQDYYNKTFGKGKKKTGQPGQSAWAEKDKDLKEIKGLKDLLLFKYKRADALVDLNYGVSGNVATEEPLTTNNKKKSNKKKNTKTPTKTTEEVVTTDSNNLQQTITEAIKAAKAEGSQLDDNTVITKVLGTVMQTLGLDPNDEDVAKLISDTVTDQGGLGRDDDSKHTSSENTSNSTTDKKLPYDIDKDSLIGRLQGAGGIKEQGTLAQILSVLQSIDKKVPTIGKSGVKSSAQNLLEEFQKMAMGSAMDGKERVAYFDLVNGAMSPSLSGATHSISQKLLDNLSQQFGIDKGYRSQVHTHADSNQTWFSSKDLDHFKKNVGDFGADSVKQQILLTKDTITVFDMTMVETAENAKKAIDILKNAGSNINNNVLEQLANLGARYQTQNLDMGAKSLMDLLGVKNYKNDGKRQNSTLTEEQIEKRKGDYETFAKRMADTSNSQYVFKSFDGETFKYQLVDLEGHISKVVLAWDELQDKVHIVSDTSTSSMDPLIQKIQQYKSEIQSAQKELLLSSGDDASFVAAEQTVNDIVDKIQTGNLSGEDLSKALDELAIARQKLAEEGAKLHKLIAKNNKLRSGTKEVNSAITQGVQVRSALGDALEMDDRDGVQLFDVSDNAPEYLQNYVSAYNNLVEVQQQYIKTGQINNPKIQDALKVQAESVKKLGREAVIAYQNTQNLQGQADIWQQQTYTDKAGQQHALGGTKYVGNGGVDRTAMLQYAKEVLGADLANVKLNTTTGKLTGVLRKNNYVVADMAVQYDKATGKMHLFQEQERESLGGLPGFMKALKEKSKAITQYLMSMTSIYRVIGELRKGIQYVREIDSALTELKKVTDETEESYERFLDTAAKTADRVGSTIKEVVSSTADWARIGYSLEEAHQLAESTAVLLNVSEFQSIEDATSALTSTLQAFGYTAKDSMQVVDVLNEVGKLVAPR